MNKRIEASTNKKQHWENTYTKSSINKLGWYEETPKPSLDLIAVCGLKKSDKIFHAGAGASTLLDSLIDMGFTHHIVNDISSIALEKLKARLGFRSRYVRWIVDDLTGAQQLNEINDIALWIDRAVLHFFIEKEQQEYYFSLIKKLVNPNGYVLLATFAINGATMCSGLPVQQYDEEMLQNSLGREFKLLDYFHHNHTMPSGDSRKYIYTLFKRNDRI